MKALTIAIDRRASQWAVFDEGMNFISVKAFTSYTSEARALAEARTWCKKQGCAQPQVVYPNIAREPAVKRRRTPKEQAALKQYNLENKNV